MPDYLMKLLCKKYTLKSNQRVTYSTIDIIAFAIITIVGIMVRICFFQFESNDFLGFLNNWVEHFRLHGFQGIADGLYDYTPTYMYALYIVSIVPIKRIVGIKLISVIFDFVLAIAVALIITKTENIQEKVNIPKLIFSYGLVLLTPTVISNSSMWGQCDSIYVSFIILMLYLFIQRKPSLAMIALGAAFALKLQSIFILPVVLLLWVCKRFKTKSFLYLPMIYIITILPTWVAGRKLKDLLLIYANQAKSNSVLSLKWPNIFYLLGEDMFVEMYGKAAIWFTLGLLLLVFYYLVTKCLVIGINDKLLIHISLFSVMLVTYFLPFMHERYGYLADILCIIFAFYYTNKFYVPILHIGISFLSYTRYYTKNLQEETVPTEILAIILLIIIIDVGYSLYKTISELEKLKLQRDIE